MNIADILGKHKKNQSVALRYQNRSVTYEKLYQSAGQLSEKLFGNFEIVGMYLSNSIEYVTAFFAILMAGKKILPIPISYRPEEIKNTLKFCEISMLLTESRYGGMFSGNLDLKTTLVDKFEYQNDYMFRENNDSDENETAIIFPTSGTTGQQKYVQLTHKNSVTNAISSADIGRFQESDTELAVLPFTAAYSLSAVLLSNLISGSTIRIFDGIFELNKFFRLVEQDQIQYINMVPSLLRAVIRGYNKEKHNVSSLKRIIVGGEKLLEKDMQDVNQIFPHITLLQGYGLTEASPIIASQTQGDDLVKKKGSVGKPIKDVHIKIVDQNNNEVKAGKTGRIFVSGPNIMKGYYKRENDATVKDGWLNTGDVGHVDQEGYLYITGREKNIIISGGRNIHPEEVEEVILLYASVKEVRVSGIPDDTLGEIAVAEIVPEENQEFPLKDLVDFCKGRLALYKIPRKILFVEKFEKNDMKKMKRINK